MAAASVSAWVVEQVVASALEPAQASQRVM
jgi:hypothetical protein